MDNKALTFCLFELWKKKINTVLFCCSSSSLNNIWNHFSIPNMGTQGDTHFMLHGLEMKGYCFIYKI